MSHKETIKDSHGDLKYHNSREHTSHIFVFIALVEGLKCYVNDFRSYFVEYDLFSSLRPFLYFILSYLFV